MCIYFVVYCFGLVAVTCLCGWSILTVHSWYNVCLVYNHVETGQPYVDGQP